jgi:hypothetical protein
MGTTLGTIAIVIAIIALLIKSSKTEEMWEILVPASNKIQEFTYEHHKAWDEFVIGISGGITIMKTVKGEWVSPNNVRFKDRMIPVRIKCSADDIDKIIDFTIKHYEQEAVLAYKISEEVILRNKSELEDE